MADKQITVTTAQILSFAYATIFGITTDRGGGIGHYYGQYAGESCIEYADFSSGFLDFERPFDDDNDYFECVTEDGSEGCWIRVELVHYCPMTPDKFHDKYERHRVGIIKTLDEGRNAWKNMGALAGELAYVANYEASRKVIKRAAQLAAENK